MASNAKIDDLLSRADDEVLQELLGKKIVKLLNILDTKLTTTRMREVLVSMKSREGLLLDRNARNQLFDCMRPGDARSLAKKLGASERDEAFAFIKQSRTGNKANLPVLFEYFDLALPELDAEEDYPDLEISEPGYALFTHQRKAARKVICMLGTDPYRVLLHMPTGAGKTRTAMNVIAEYLRAHEPCVVVWLAHSEELCDQAASEFLRAWHQLGNREIGLHRFWGAHELDVNSINDGIVIAGLPKTYSRAKKSIKFLAALGKKTRLIIMDEAHQGTAPTYKLVLDALSLSFGHNEHTSLLGLSATPGRTYSDPEEDAKLSRLFAKRKVTLEVEGYKNPVDYLVAEGYLAKANYRPLMYESGLTLSKADLAHIQEQFDISDDVLQKIAEDERRNLRIISEIENLTSRHKRVIVFAISVEHSNLIAATLKARGTHAYSVTGSTPRQLRQKTLKDYKSDAEGCRVLCNFGVLTTGFDAPRTSAAVIARPTVSLVLYSQMVGRAIRGPRAGGNAEAEIVTVVDSSLTGFGDIAAAFNNWEDIWGD